MNKFLLLLIISTIGLVNLQGCSFIKEKFFRNQRYNNQEEQQNEEPQKKSDPIPTNPQHS